MTSAAHVAAIVVRSGFGGPVMTYRLQEAGQRVCPLANAALVALTPLAGGASALTLMFAATLIIVVPAGWNRRG